MAAEAARKAFAASYKAMKEDFVSNLSGGGIMEINVVTAVAPAAVMLWSALQIRESVFTPYTPIAFAADFFLNVVCILLAMTFYSSHSFYLNMFLIAPAVLLFTIPKKPPRKKAKKPPAKKAKKPPRSTANKLPAKIANKPENEERSPSPNEIFRKDQLMDPLPKKPFVTTYRGCMMVVTCVAILAVDFPTFPRRFAKVETWGTSLMDLGVGSFVFSAGVVAARAVLKEQMKSNKTRLSTRLYQSARHSLPLLVLGLVRLYSVKGLDYAEHVTEYGVHWNFFFTLGFLPPFVAVFQSLLKYVPSYAALAMLLGSVYQIALESTSLKAFILTAPRDNLFSQNREGIFSFFGYLAIFLVGQATGMYVLPRKCRNGLRKEYVYQQEVLIKLGGWCGLWSIIYLFITDYEGLNLSVSRRLANLPYIVWVSALNCGQLFAFCSVETVFFSRVLKEKSVEGAYQFATSRVLHAFNRNGLVVFLVANLLTGLVNLTVDTLLTDDQTAVLLLMGYAAVVTGLAVGLDAYDITVKL